MARGQTNTGVDLSKYCGGNQNIGGKWDGVMNTWGFSILGSTWLPPSLCLCKRGCRKQK